MTCVWLGILAKIKPPEINKVLAKNCEYISINEVLLVKLLKENVTMTMDVLWKVNNDKPELISHKQMQENLDWILDYDPNKIREGHFCSICDPFLLLISQLFVVNIIHNYNGVTINYINQRNEAGRTLTFSSNTDHFW